MANDRAHKSEGKGRAGHRFAKVAGLAVSVAMFGMVGLSGTLAQEEDVSVGVADAESIVAEIFAQIFGGGAAEDEATVSGDINVGGNRGGTVMMGGSSAGGITIGGGISGDDTGG